jgi:hypothetical protein
MDSILNSSWNWGNNHGVQIGSLFLSFLSSYEKCVGALANDIEGLLPQADLDYVAGIGDRIKSFDPSEFKSKIDLGLR